MLDDETAFVELGIRRQILSRTELMQKLAEMARWNFVPRTAADAIAYGRTHVIAPLAEALTWNLGALLGNTRVEIALAKSDGDWCVGRHCSGKQNPAMCIR